jgi:hypothetical protein
MIDDPVIGEWVSLGMGPDVHRSLRKICDVIIYATSNYEARTEICIKSERATGPAYTNYTTSAFHRVMWTFAGPKRVTWRSHNPQRGIDVS